MPGAEASSSRVEPHSVPGKSGEQDERPPTSGSARTRDSYYEAQRVRRPSRPTSGNSYGSRQSRGKSGSYQQPATTGGPDEINETLPTHPKSGPPSLLDPNTTDSAHARGPDERSETSDNVTPPPFHSRQPEDYLPADSHESSPTWLTELFTVAHLVMFAILGTLARLGVQWITFYAGAPVVTPVLWANVAGSLLMGFLAEDENLFKDRYAMAALEMKSQNRKSDASIDIAALRKAEGTKRKKVIPLYVGLATGLCGSFTSFSSFERDVFLALSNDLPTPINHPYDSTGEVSTTSARARPDGYSVESLLAVILLTIGVCIGALRVGSHIALFLDNVTPTFSKGVLRRAIDPLVVFLGFGSWLGAVLLSIWPPHDKWRGEVTFALVFAPLGCLLRFYASKRLNVLVPSFPLGTFAVNMLGTAIIGMCYDIQHGGVGGRISCQVLQGLMDGFCGCLTTISTWVAEIHGLKLKHAYLYAIASTAGGLCLLVAIMGSVRWSVGWSEAVCITGYVDKPM